MVTRHALVTGATGGLGRTLVPMLVADGWQVTATGRNAAIGAGMGVPFVAADLTRDPPEAALGGVDTVFHLAALSSPWGETSVFRKINVDATDRLVRAAMRSGVRRFVYASTPSIYAAARDRLDLTEADPVAVPFANVYAETKHMAEEIVLAADCAAMGTIAIRPRAIVGPDDTVLLPRLMRAVKNGYVRLPDGGSALIEITDARDAAAAFIAAGTANCGGLAFNVSGGQPRSVRQLLSIIFSVLDTPITIGSVPAGVALMAAKLVEMLALMRPGRPEPPLTTYAVKTLAYSQTFDLSAARNTLRWAPQHSPEDAIAHALAGRASDA